MKKIFSATVLSFILTLVLGAGWVTAADHSGHGGHGGQAAIQVYSAEGIIKAIAPDKLTISHEPIPSLGWPAMTMNFALAEQSLSQDLKIDDQVRFDFTAQGNTYIIIELEIME
jgi:Cu/Ag efflux protein CusF